MYITNNLKDQQNDKSLKSCDDWADKRTSIAKDESRHKVSLNKHVPINKTAGLTKELTICVGARVMLTTNKDVEDKLINGSTGIVKHIQGLRNNKPSGVIFVQFDNPLSGSKLKDPRLRGELKTCVPILPEVKTFKTSSEIFVTRKQFPLIVAFATTIHKAQGSTLEYASGDLDQTTRSGKGLAPVGQGLLYTLLSRATSSDKIHLQNFIPERHIVVNSEAKKAMEEMRKNKVLSLVHPLEEMNSENLSLYNIRSWNLHINHFLSNGLHTSRCCLLCFTETGNNARGNIEDDEKLQHWKTIHQRTTHGLAISYDTKKVSVIKNLNTVSELELLPLLVSIKNKHYFIVLLYRPPASSVPLFAQSLRIELEIDTIKYSTIILGDFNLPDSKDVLNEALPPNIFHQRCQHPTHIDGNILDFIFDDQCNTPAEWMPSPYSDHFTIFIDLIHGD